MRVFSTIISLQLILSSVSQAGENAALSLEETQATIKEIEKFAQQAKKLSLALLLDPEVKKDVKSSPQVGASLSAEYSEIYHISTQLMFFENSAFRARQLTDSSAKKAILSIVVRQYLIYAMKLNNRVSANCVIMDVNHLNAPLKRRLKNQNELSEKLKRLCFKRIRAIMKIEGMEHQLNEQVLNCMRGLELID